MAPAISCKPKRRECSSIAACSGFADRASELNQHNFRLIPQPRCHAADPRPYRSYRPYSKLVKNGFNKKIRAPATVDLCAVMLPDSGFIRVRHEVQNKRNRQRGLPEVEPLYTLEDAMNALERFSALDYETWIEPAKGIRARWWNAEPSPQLFQSKWR